MSTLQLDRQSARRRTRVAGAIGAALLAGGLWYGAWAIANDRAPASAESILAGAVADVPKPAPMRTVSTSVDLPAAGTNLARIANRPVPPTPTPTAAAGAAPAPAQPAMSVRFLGVITEPNRLLALLHAGGRQRVVGVDAVVPADPEGSRLLRVRQVTRDAIVLLDGSKEIRLERAARTGPAVTYVAANPELAAAGGTIPGYAPTGVPSNPPYPAGVAGGVSSTGQPLTGLDRMREMQRSFEQRRGLASAVPEVKVIGGDAVGETDGEAPPPAGVPKAVPIPPDGDKPK
ncbi:MAG: hypothetical protein FJ255_05435 [Phycisphaerae bacterium]|nr:hypothetical protein [Phycisphaerae bacterium]